MPVRNSQLASVFNRDYLLVFPVLILLIVISWVYISNLSNSTDSMKEVSMIQGNEWMLNDFIAVFAMWSAMMIAMMLPSAVPMILVFSTVNRKRRENGNSFVGTWIFVLGNVIVWVSFGFVASLLQFVLHNLSVISDQLKLINPFASGIVLVAAGIYQFTTVKDVCLNNCQSPLSFVLSFWKEGKTGAFLMGIRHGIYCMGCCWLLMALLFVAGIMNILWIALIAVFVVIEKMIKKQRLVSYAAGFALIILGFWLIL